jgi:hypothetical protein
MVASGLFPGTSGSAARPAHGKGTAGSWPAIRRAVMGAAPRGRTATLRGLRVHLWHGRR